VALGQLEFPELMKRIIRTDGALAEIDRLLGIDDAGAAPPAEGGEAAPMRRRKPPGM
jgi:hypothetical protein